MELWDKRHCLRLNCILSERQETINYVSNKNSEGDVKSNIVSINFGVPKGPYLVLFFLVVYK